MYRDIKNHLCQRWSWIFKELSKLCVKSFFECQNQFSRGLSKLCSLFFSIFNKFTQFDISNIARPLLTDFKGCTKCCLVTFHQLFQKVTAQIQIKFRLNF
jgi:hypothetical protein